MISAVHLIWLLPMCFMAGFSLCAMFVANEGGDNV